MIPMARIAVILLVMSAALGSTARAAESTAYSESYAIILKGDFAGTETVTEKPDADGNLVSTSQHDVLVTDGLETKRMSFATRMILDKNSGIPSSYSYWYTSGDSGDSYDVTIQDSQIIRILNRGGRTSEVTVPLDPGMVFVDFNVYHQYDYLVRRYDFKKKGRQTFSNFIPVIGADIPVALTYLGEESLPLATGMLPVRKLRVEFVGILSGTLLVGNDGRLVRLTVPSQDLEVVRRDLLPDPQPPAGK